MNENVCFRDGDRFCFIGDSITQTGLYGRWISDFFTARYPQQAVSFINCGVAGENGADVLARIDRDILIHRPTKASVMLGINDIGRHLYGLDEPSVEVLQQRKQRLESYRSHLERIIVRLQENGVELYLITPSPYWESDVLAEVCLTGCNDALAECAESVRELAHIHGCRMIDFYNSMNKLQLVAPSATLIGPDRVHPVALGHRVMAYLFLTQIGASAASSLQIDTEPLGIAKMSRCEIEGLISAGGALTFGYRPFAFPLVVDETYEQDEQHVPFTRELNQDTIRICGLPEGSYEFTIDGIVVARYTSGELESGVNPALLRSSPQQAQARRLIELSTERYRLESLIRGIRYTEKHFARGRIDYNDPPTARLFVQGLLNSSEISGWHREQYTTYLAYKPKEQELFAQIRSMTQIIYETNKPPFYQVAIRMGQS